MTTQSVWTKAEVLEALKAELQFYESRHEAAIGEEEAEHLRAYFEGSRDATSRAVELIERMPEAK